MNEGLNRVLDATEVAAVVEAAVIEAERYPPDYWVSAFVQGFGTKGEVRWVDACCEKPGDACRPGYFIHYLDGKHVTRDELCAALVEAMLASNREVEAAMEPLT